MNLIRCKNNNLKNKSYQGNDSIFYFLDFYKVEYTSNDNETGFLVIELVNIFETGELPNLLTESELNSIRSGKHKLLLFYAKEPVSISFIDRSLKKLNNAGIDNSSIVLVTGDVGTEVLAGFPADLKVIQYFIFDMISVHKYTGRKYISANPSKKFLCYNGTAKLHRTLLFNRLCNSTAGYISYLKRNYDPQMVINEIEQSNLSHDEKEQAKDVSFSAPVQIDLSLSDYIADHYSDNYLLYDDTAFSIVTESLTGPGTQFITEKTFKSILSMHPFMIIGNPGVLAYLHQCGYETFDFIFDESYDSAFDPQQKIVAVVSEVEKFSLEHYHECKERIRTVAEHNRAVCLTKDYAAHLTALLMDISRNENTVINTIENRTNDKDGS